MMRPAFAYDCFSRRAHSGDFDGARFTGKERDAESGNDYFGARYYASTMGRFLSPDWSAKEEPVPYAKLDNPQTLNLYQYMENNPLGGVDPDGHCDVCMQLLTEAATSVSIYLGNHPEVAAAVDQFTGSLGVKLSVGAGRTFLDSGGAKVGASVSLTSEARLNGTSSTSVQGTVAASVNGVGVQANGTAALEKNGSAVNPLKNLGGNAKVTGAAGDNPKAVATAGTDDRVAVGVAVNVGVGQASAQVTAGAREAQGVVGAVVNAAVQDTRRGIEATQKCTSSGCLGMTSH